MPYKMRFELHSNDPDESFDTLEAARDVLIDAARSSRWGFGMFHVLDCDTGLEHHYSDYGSGLRHYSKRRLTANFEIDDRLGRECGCMCTISQRQDEPDSVFHVGYVALRDGRRYQASKSGSSDGHLTYGAALDEADAIVANYRKRCEKQFGKIAA